MKVDRQAMAELLDKVQHVNHVESFMNTAMDYIVHLAQSQGWNAAVIIDGLLGMAVHVGTSSDNPELPPVTQEEVREHCVAILESYIQHCFGPKTYWFHCKGCGNIAGYIVKDCEMGKAGCVVHTKPKGHNNIPVQCTLFRLTRPAQYWALHAEAERIDGPTQIQPVELSS